MERLTEMKEYILPKWKERFNEDIGKIQTHYNRHQSEIILTFRKYIDDNLFSKTKDKLSFGRQDDPLCLIISYLHSSVLSRSYEYEFSLCNELLFVDRNMVTVYWCPEFLYRYTGEEEVFIQKELQRKFIRIKKYELKTLRRDLFISYQDVAKEYFMDLTTGIREKEKLEIYYGEHMGELAELYYKS